MSFLALDAAEKLEKFYRALHGIHMGCPTCGSRGKLDTLSEEIAEFKDSIWWNPTLEQWECSDCYLK